MSLMFVLSHRSTRHHRLALVCALLLCGAEAQAAGPTGLLNDTGQTLCDDGSNVMAACTVGTTGDAATYKRQDGRFGRDPAAPARWAAAWPVLTSPRSVSTAL